MSDGVPGKSGYLQHRPGGALGRWKKKRYWFILDPSLCKLSLHKSQGDINGTPLGTIDIKDACITLLLEHSNQFLVSVDGKEHILSADNHSNMMDWLQSMQEVRDSLKGKKGSRIRQTMKSFSGRATATATPLEGLASNGHIPPENLQVQLRRYTSADFSLAKQSSLDNTESGNSIHNGVRASISMPGNLTVSAVSDSQDTLLSPESMTSLSSRISHSSTEDTGSMGDLVDGPTSATDQNGKESFLFDETTDQDDELESRDETTSEEDLEEMDKACLIRKIMELKEDVGDYRRKLTSLENREETYVQMLRKREQDIMNLDDKLGQLEQKKHISRDLVSGEDIEAAHRKVRDLQDTCKMYQDQNAFLNQEVRKQAALKCRAKAKVLNMEKKLVSVDSALVNSKREFLKFLRTLFEVSSLDHKDRVSMDLDWEDSKLSGFLQLFEHARKQDPHLPDPRLLMAEGFTDSHGFRHCAHNQPLLFHHLCHLLDRHLVAFSKKQLEHRKKWDDYIKKTGEKYMENKVTLKDLVYDGIPPDRRSSVWTQLILDRVKEYKVDKGEDYFETLCAKANLSSAVDSYRRQINLDLLRTMPQNMHFNNENSKGIAQLRQVLEAFCVHSPNIGYCQGMNFIVGMSLLFMDSENAFWCLVAVVEQYFPANYFDASLIGAQADQNVLKDVLEVMLPDLHAHLDDVGVEMCSFTLNWFLAMFFEVVPFQTLLRIWDCFLLEGLTSLFQFSVALLKYHEKALLKKKDILAFLKDTKSLARLTFDIEAIVHIVKENRETFPAWSWIQERQAHYMKTLRKVYEEQERAREEFERLEGLTRPHNKPSMGDLTGSETDLLVDMGIEFTSGRLLVTRSDVKHGWISKVDVQLRTKESLGVRLDSRVMCITMAGENLMLVGTLSWYLYAYTLNTREEMWCERLRDTPLCLEFDSSNQTVYIGLSDGTLAVIENVSTCHPVEVFYHAIGAAPIRGLVKIKESGQLWCACGNAVNILDRSLNITNGFEISRSTSCHISSIKQTEQGVWVTIRGSSVISLWDPVLVLCVLMYDTSTDQSAMWKKNNSEHSVHSAKVTSFLPYDETVWVGTSDGQLGIYLVRELECDQIHVPSPMEDKNGLDSFLFASRKVSAASDAGELSGRETPVILLESHKTVDGEEEIDINSDVIQTSTNQPLDADENNQEKEPPINAETDSIENGNLSDKGDLLNVMDADDVKSDNSLINLNTLEGFVVVGSEEKAALKAAEEESNKTGQNGNTENSDGESSQSPGRRKNKGYKKGSKAQLNSPKSRSRLLISKSSSKDKSTDSEGSVAEDFDRTPQNSPKLKVPTVLDKLTHRHGNKKKKYRYSQVMREAERRGLLPEEELGAEQEQKMDSLENQSHVTLGRGRSSTTSVEFNVNDIEVCPHFELQLKRKCRISEHQVRALILSRLQSGEPAIISCAGYYADDESLLRWTCHIRENVWMQVPIEETT